MNKTLQKLLSLVLALCLTASLVPLSTAGAFAAEDDAQSTLTALEIGQTAQTLFEKVGIYKFSFESKANQNLALSVKASSNSYQYDVCIKNSDEDELFSKSWCYGTCYGVFNAEANESYTIEFNVQSVPSKYNYPVSISVNEFQDIELDTPVNLTSADKFLRYVHSGNPMVVGLSGNNININCFDSNCASQEYRNSGFAATNGTTVYIIANSYTGSSAITLSKKSDIKSVEFNSEQLVEINEYDTYAFFSYTPAQDQYVEFNLYDSSIGNSYSSHKFSVLNSNSIEICSTGYYGTSLPCSLNAELEAGETYIIKSGFSRGDTGSFKYAILDASEITVGKAKKLSPAQEEKDYDFKFIPKNDGVFRLHADDLFDYNVKAGIIGSGNNTIAKTEKNGYNELEVFFKAKKGEEYCVRITAGTKCSDSDSDSEGFTLYLDEVSDITGLDSFEYSFGSCFAYTAAENAIMKFTGDDNLSSISAETINNSYIGSDSYYHSLDVPMLKGETYILKLSRNYNDATFSNVGIKKLSDIKTLELGKTEKINIENEGDYKYFAFTPDLDETLELKTTNSSQTTRAIIYDSQHTIIADTYNEFEKQNFVYPMSFKAGETYLIRLGYNYINYTGSFDFVLSKAGEFSLGETKENCSLSAPLYYTFTPQEDASVCFDNNKTWDFSGNLNISVKDSSSAVIASKSISVRDNATIFFDAKKDETYAISIIPSDLEAYYYDEEDVKFELDFSLMAVKELMPGEEYNKESYKKEYFKYTASKDNVTSLNRDSSYFHYNVYNSDGKELCMPHFSKEGEIYYIIADTNSGVFTICENTEEIKVGDTKTAVFPLSDSNHILLYKSDKDQTLRYYSTEAEYYASTSIYDVDTGKNLSAYRASKNTDKNFELYFNVQAGKTYFFANKYNLPSGKDGTYKVHLEACGEGSYGYAIKTTADQTDNEAAVLKYFGDKSNINVPSEHELKTVTEIAYKAFANCNCLVSVNIPDSVKKIKNSSFYWCDNLEKVRLPEGLETIEEGVFEDNHSLTEINIPSTVTSIEALAFADCISLKSIELPENLEIIGKAAFSGCFALKEITIPSSVTEIGEHALGYGSYSTFNNNAKPSSYDEPVTLRENEKIPGFVIKCYRNTAAEQYAVDNGFEFVALDDTQHAVGDIDGDGVINIADATLVQKIIAKFSDINNIDKSAADVNHDSLITIDDVTLIQMRAANFIENFD